MIPKFTTIKVGQAILWRFGIRAVQCTNRWAAMVLKMRTSQDDDAQFDFLNPDPQH